MGHLSDNVVHFGRVLRAAGLPVGPDRIVLALEAVATTGFAHRADFRATLAATLVARREHRAMFDQAFDAFWRDPDLRGRMISLLLPRVDGKVEAPQADNARLAAALYPKTAESPRPRNADLDEIEFDASLTFSDRELLRKTDFDAMTPEEWAQARKLVADIAPMIDRIITRRSRSASRGHTMDWRATLSAQARAGGDSVSIAWKHRVERPAPLVVIADISGSMSRYTRMFLHFVHALASGPRASDIRIQAFVFGTRLTHITRQLRTRDPDIALEAVVAAVDDWSGGTRIAPCLRAFNQRWSRRVLGQSATVLLLTDGLERDDASALAFEAERLAKSCRRLVWLNPLLRYAAFEAKPAGVRALMPHVDAFLPVHNIESLDALALQLARSRSP